MIFYCVYATLNSNDFLPPFSDRFPLICAIPSTSSLSHQIRATPLFSINSELLAHTFPVNSLFTSSYEFGTGGVGSHRNCKPPHHYRVSTFERPRLHRARFSCLAQTARGYT